MDGRHKVAEDLASLVAAFAYRAVEIGLQALDLGAVEGAGFGVKRDDLVAVAGGLQVRLKRGAPGLELGQSIAHAGAAEVTVGHLIDQPAGAALDFVEFALEAGATLSIGGLAGVGRRVEFPDRLFDDGRMQEVLAQAGENPRLDIGALGRALHRASGPASLPLRHT